MKNEYPFDMENSRN